MTQVKARSILLAQLFAVAASAQMPATWTKKSPAVSPSARQYHAMAYDSARHQVVLFGGTNLIQNGSSVLRDYLNDTWVWDGATWTQKFPQTIPAGRGYHAMAFDAARGQMVMFGGYTTAGSIPDDTWLWDGSNWKQADLITKPPARIEHAMAYDVVRKEVVLFGGDRSFIAGAYNDTWVWDGATWRQKSPGHVPFAVIRHSLVYDSARNQTVLFGGVTDLLVPSAEIWTWDGADWTRKTPETSPSARWKSGFAFDSAHNQSVLLGGSDSRLTLRQVTTGNVLGDTWLWDGSNWTARPAQVSPPGRSFPGMAYDTDHSEIVIFGGYNGTANLNDTWTFNAGVLTPVISAVVSASGFGGFKSVTSGSWVEIYGSNFTTLSRTWTGADFSGNSAPTALDGVQVTIGGKRAFVDFISPTQVNAQLPSGLGTGVQQVIVGNSGANSAAFNITVNSSQPGLLAPAAFSIGGNQYAVALLPDSGAYVLAAGAIPGVVSRPAKPGETILFFGIGFGAVTPNVDAGQIVTAANQLAASLQIQFGSTPAEVSYAGLAPGFVGLYQFNVVVPAVADNDLTLLKFSVGGAAGTQTLYTAVRQ